MAKPKTVYACQSCGAQSPKWLGKCPDCNQWNTFVEETYTAPSSSAGSVTGDSFFTLTTDKPLPLNQISLVKDPRFSCGSPELDRVLGGGVVPGSLILVGGDPGIGKSTLILQALHRMHQKKISVLYVTGEESAAQIKMRADRLEIDSDLLVIAENSLARIIDHIKKVKPQVVVVDSIQTVYVPELESAPGSVSQVRESAGKLLYLSKTMGIATVLIGHVTKEGALAGPRVLEHMVDCVLYFEGDGNQHYRILRTIKNRYGSTNEIGVFEMTQKGLAEVQNPSSLFLSEHPERGVGSVVTAALEGMRPFLVEIQGLVSQSSLANPRRTTLGVDNGRVAIIVAVLEKIVGLNLYAQDIYVNATGGFKITEPGADLAVLSALVSSFKNRPITPHTLILGEVGLSGEIRGVNGIEIRVNEAQKMGFKRCILPKNIKKVEISTNIELLPVKTVSQALEALF